VTLRRSWAAALLWAAALSPLSSACGQVPSWSLEAQRRLLAGAGDAVPALAERQRLAEAGEARLAAGDAEGARAAFDRAALMVHSPDVEMGLVRADLQAGDYRRALAFAAHAAGAHRNVPGGTALYAWLLHLGGQGVVARHLVREARETSPDDASLRAVGELLEQEWPRPQGVLMAPPLRAAPYAAGPAVPAAARTVGTAALAGQGRVAWVSAEMIGDARSIWVRNGLGQTAVARVVGPPTPASSTPALLHLALEPPLPCPGGIPAPSREPFAGSPGYTLEYAPGAGAEPAWPLLRQGFLGRPLAQPGDRLLGIDAPAGPRGGPVFDAQGRLAGVALRGQDGRDRLLAAAALGEDYALPATGAAPAAARAAIDEVYELGLRLALQVLVLP
jgi:hypothetical protein